MEAGIWLSALILFSLLIWLWRQQQKKKLQQTHSHILDQLYKTGPTAELADVFDQALVIALPQRKEYITQALDSYHVQPIFIRPVLVADIAAPVPAHMRKTEAACYLSHIRAMTTFLQHPEWQTVVIFEDDLRFCPNLQKFQRRMASLKQELQQLEWDILYLGRCLDRCGAQSHVSPQLVHGGTPLCLHAYALTRRGAAIILKHSTSIQVAIDVQLKHLVRRRKLKSLTLVPSVFYQNKAVQTTLGHADHTGECTLDKRDFYQEQT